MRILVWDFFFDHLFIVDCRSILSEGVHRRVSRRGVLCLPVHQTCHCCRHETIAATIGHKEASAGCVRYTHKHRYYGGMPRHNVQRLTRINSGTWMMTSTPGMSTLFCTRERFQTLISVFASNCPRTLRDHPLNVPQSRAGGRACSGRSRQVWIQ